MGRDIIYIHDLPIKILSNTKIIMPKGGAAMTQKQNENETKTIPLDWQFWKFVFFCIVWTVIQWSYFNQHIESNHIHLSAEHSKILQYIEYSGFPFSDERQKEWDNMKKFQTRTQLELNQLRMDIDELKTILK